MPLYEFECEACKTRFDRIQKYTDPNPDVCPTCGKGPTRKMPSSPAIQFKGSGFYITDYAKKSSSEASSGASGESKSESKTSESKPAETKSETKSDTKSTDTKSTDAKN